MTINAKTVNVSINRLFDEVYQYLADPARIAEWSVYITDMKRMDDGDWLASTPQGSVTIRFCPRNEFGILDHWVTVNKNQTVYVPMRVLMNPRGGSDVIFTVFRQPGMSDEQFDDDSEMVLTDLARLKERLDGARL